MVATKKPNSATAVTVPKRRVQHGLDGQRVAKKAALPRIKIWHSGYAGLHTC
jgi:hypothetical protein